MVLFLYRYLLRVQSIYRLTINEYSRKIHHRNSSQLFPFPKDVFG